MAYAKDGTPQASIVLNVVKRAVKTGEKVTFSSGNIPYDVIHIDDAVSAFRLAGERLLRGGFRLISFGPFPTHFRL